jgi:sodium-dependent dicarboxylate transporter 2/3/5
MGLLKPLKNASRPIALTAGLLAILISYFAFGGNPELTKWSMAAVALTMATWWIFEVAPLGITALLPLVAFPLLGILSTKKVAPVYMSSTLFLFVGGFFVALSMQRWNLHRRIALSIINFFGSSPSRVTLGFMTATWFLSMWISNTATTVMMVSIGLAIISNFNNINMKEESKQAFATCLMLSIAYSATVGGMATLVGTPPNLAFSRLYAMSFPDAAELSFSQWLTYGLPSSIFIYFIIFFVLKWRFLKNSEISNLSPEFIKQELKKMGRLSYEEKVVFAVFALMATLWIFRKPLNLGILTLPGWSQLLKHPDLVDDGTVAIFCTLILYLVPSRNKPGEMLLKTDAIRNIPWETILLFGGGFALAKGMASSGLSQYLGNQFTSLASLPLLGTMTALAAGMSFLTELTSNMASTEMILPILASMAKSLNVNPLLFMIPTTLAASCAFMLPAATAPNAIIFSSGKVTIKQMIKTGFWINILSFSFIGIWCWFII